MNIYGIICEYNPFHNGHLYHVGQARKLGADAIICVMSGNFVQRGDFAIMQKHARAEAAVMCGADLVTELPLPWATASAERFAHGAVSILNSLNIVSHLCFGSECGDVQSLCRAAEMLLSDELNRGIAEEYSKGISYASARELALKKMSPRLSELLKTPNNILAIEYIKALFRLDSKITPVSVRRFGAAHDDASVCENTASASYIRQQIESGNGITHLLPSASAEIYKREVSAHRAPVLIKNADTAILTALKRMSAEDFTRYADVSEGLQFRLCDAVAKSTTLSEAVDLAKTKRYAHSRIRRIYLNAFLGVDGSYCREAVPYARVLAFNDTGREIIRLAKKSSDIPVITRPASIKNENKSSIELLALERRADDIYSLFMEKPISQGSTFTQSPIYVKG